LDWDVRRKTFYILSVFLKEDFNAFLNLNVILKTNTL